MLNAPSALTDISSLTKSSEVTLPEDDEYDEDAQMHDAVDFSFTGGAAVVNDAQHGIPQDHDSDEDDNNDQDDIEDNDEVPSASGSEFSAGSEDVKKREKEDDALEQERLDNLSKNMANGQYHANNENHHSARTKYEHADADGRGAGGRNKAGAPKGVSVINDAELDPDLYGLRRSVGRHLTRTCRLASGLIS